MKKISLIILALAMMASCAAPEQPADEPAMVNDGVFIHMTHGHDNPHRVLMPLQMAAMMATDKDVLIYMDIDAVKLLTQYADDVEYAHFTPLKESLANLLQMGVTIFACPGCMKAHEIEEADLMEGIQVAQKEKFFSFTEGKIVSLTY
ncbi:MAG: peroxiredoxin [Bacteroidetes bacterium]|nr:MAG: peroxiredoxin [Bacteroidota bacterium]